MNAKTHYIPQPVIDCVEKAFDFKNSKFTSDTYIVRIEAIRDYCNDALNKLSIKSVNRDKK